MKYVKYFLFSIAIFLTSSFFAFAGYINSPQTTNISFVPVCENSEQFVAIHYNEGNGVIDQNGNLITGLGDSDPYNEALYNQEMIACGVAYNISYVGTFDYEFYNSQDINDNTDIGTFSIEAQQNQTWGSSNGFWGDNFTVNDIEDTLVASVQGTGANIWPLVALVGVPIGFLIAIWVSTLINDSVSKTEPKRKRGRPRKTIINPDGEDFIYHSAKDLEFKREYAEKHMR